MNRGIEETIIIKNNKMVYAVRLKDKEDNKNCNNPYMIVADGRIQFIDRLYSSSTEFNFSDEVHQTAKEIFISGLRAAVKERLLELKQLSLILDEMGLKDCLGDSVEVNARMLLNDNNDQQKQEEAKTDESGGI